MNFLLDTCVLSEVLKPKPVKSVLAWLEKAEDSALYLSVLSVGELQKGISKLQATDPKRASVYSGFLKEKIIAQYRDRIIPLDLDVLLRWGEVTGALAAEGGQPQGADGLIAATALVHGLGLVTRNEKDFRGTGVHLLNPWN